MRPKNSTLTARQVHRCAAAILYPKVGRRLRYRLSQNPPRCLDGILGGLVIDGEEFAVVGHPGSQVFQTLDLIDVEDRVEDLLSDEHDLDHRSHADRRQARLRCSACHPEAIHADPALFVREGVQSTPGRYARRSESAPSSSRISAKQRWNMPSDCWCQPYVSCSSPGLPSLRPWT